MTDRAALVADVNQDAPEHGSVEHIATIPFGAALHIEHYRLKNGLDVLLLPDDSAPVIAFHAWFRVGSRHEKPGKTGLSHLFEHLMFNEVEGLAAGEFDAKMEAAGADNNASTWLDFTQYQEAFPKQHLDMVLDLEARRMHQLVLRDPQVDSEKEVVKNERRYRVEDDVEGTVEELLWKTAFEKHSYHWPTIGWMEDIEGFSTEDCREFYKTYYAPNNASVILVGDLNEKDALLSLMNTYGKLPPSEIPPEESTPEPPQTSERCVEIQQPTPTEKVVLGYKSPAIGHEDHALCGILVDVLSGGRASKLHKRLVRKDKICSDVSGHAGPHVHPSLIEFSLAARDGHTCEELLAAFDEEIELLNEGPIAQSDLDRSRNRSELGLLGSLETADGKASNIGFYQTVLGRPSASFERLQRLEGTSVDDLWLVAKKYFRKESRTVIKVRPGGEEEAADA